MQVSDTIIWGVSVIQSMYSLLHQMYFASGVSVYMMIFTHYTMLSVWSTFKVWLHWLVCIRARGKYADIQRNHMFLFWHVTNSWFNPHGLPLTNNLAECVLYVLLLLLRSISRAQTLSPHVARNRMVWRRSSAVPHSLLVVDSSCGHNWCLCFR